MAKIEKKGDNVTFTMSIDEIVLLQGFIEDAGNVAARARHSTKDNSLACREAQIVMSAMWSLSDHLSVPTDPKHSYTQEFRLP